MTSPVPAFPDPADGEQCDEAAAAESGDDYEPV